MVKDKSKKEKQICVDCPRVVCKGKLDKLETKGEFTKYKCDSCKSIMYMDESGCGTYE
jgi:hypothetical protein